MALSERWTIYKTDDSGQGLWVRYRNGVVELSDGDNTLYLTPDQWEAFAASVSSEGFVALPDRDRSNNEQA